VLPGACRSLFKYLPWRRRPLCAGIYPRPRVTPRPLDAQFFATLITRGCGFAGRPTSYEESLGRRRIALAREQEMISRIQATSRRCAQNENGNLSYKCTHPSMHRQDADAI
jgi:hypothetical protein